MISKYIYMSENTTLLIAKQVYFAYPIKLDTIIIDQLLSLYLVVP